MANRTLSVRVDSRVAENPLVLYSWHRLKNHAVVLFTALLIIAVGTWGLMLFLSGPETPTISDFLYATLFLSHMVWGTSLLAESLHPLLKGRTKTGGNSLSQSKMPEVLLTYGLILFLFSYIFALNANMDYVQRFAEGKENLHIAPDSRTERLSSLMRYAPFLALDISIIVVSRLTAAIKMNSRTFGYWVRLLALPLTLLSSALYTFSLPSFVSLDGMAILGFFCLVPLLLVLVYIPAGWAPLYVTAFGVIQTMLTNFWLGTFSLVSLQVITILYLLFYLVFSLTISLVKRLSGNHVVFLIPLLWVIFDYLRSTGFLGFPWGMLGVSQYKNIPFIQIASLTGIWGVSFLVIWVNAVLAWCIYRIFGRNGPHRRIWRRPQRRAQRRVPIKALFGTTLIIGCVYGAGLLSILGEPHGDANQYTIALVQQNTDPRKNDYAEGLQILKSLTNEAMVSLPDLVVWSETAFVPNIRRWSREDPRRFTYARLVDDFLHYQRDLGTWLITGNDDYELVEKSNGETARFDYNASVLFDPEGTRTKTYRKMHLVPFTEYFPFEKQMPKFYNLLLDFDVYLWEPGTDPVVFEHPGFTFSTPICFEDGFPRDVRRFVRAGAELIINLSNDYWSLSEVEAKQHYANTIFRAIENRREFLRASASGVTSHVDKTGRLRESLPFYEESFLIVEVDIGESRTSYFTRFGDWFPVTLAAFCCLFLLFNAFGFMRRRS